MKSGEIIGQFNRTVEAAAAGLSRPDGMSLVVVSDQPAATAMRIGQFIECFIECFIGAGIKEALIQAGLVGLRAVLVVLPVWYHLFAARRRWIK